MKILLTALFVLALGPQGQTSALDLNGIRWMSCGLDKCYDLTTKEVSRSVFSKKLFAQNIVLHLVSRKKLGNHVMTVTANRAMYDSEQDEWILMKENTREDY